MTRTPAFSGLQSVRMMYNKYSTLPRGQNKFILERCDKFVSVAEGLEHIREGL